MVVVDEAGVPRPAGRRSPSIAPAWPGSSATSPARWPTPDGRSTSSARTTIVGRGGAAALLGLASLVARGPRRRVRAGTSRRIASLEKAGLPRPTLIGVLDHAWPTSGWRRVGLSEAMRILERGLALATGRGAPTLRGSGGHARRPERDRSASGTTSVAASAAPADRAGSWARRTACRRTRTARGSPWRCIRQADGDPDGALELLDEAERRYDGDFSPDVRPVAATAGAGAGSPQGRLAEARRLGARPRPHGRSTTSTYLREFEHITLARLLLADGVARSVRRSSDPRGARAPGSPAGRRPRTGGRTGSVIDILVVQALAHQAVGDTAAGARVAARARSTWRSRRATSASSSTRGRRWRPC